MSHVYKLLSSYCQRGGEDEGEVRQEGGEEDLFVFIDL